MILSSQKALALSPGLSMVILREAYYQTVVEPKEDICLYLSLKEHARNMERGQTPDVYKRQLYCLKSLCDGIADFSNVEF